MKLIRLIKLFRRLLVRKAKAELKCGDSLNICIDNATVDMIKALYAAYHGLDCAEAIEDSDLIHDWAYGVLSQIQKGLQED